MTTQPIPMPAGGPVDERELLVAYLDGFRSVVEAKVAGLSPEALRASVVPSAWTPIEMVQHLVYMEQRWFVWGFAGEEVPNPWGDHDTGPDGQWHVDPDRSVHDVLAALHDGGRTTRAIVESAGDLQARAATGGRFTDPDDAPTLFAIVMHVIQEYARHLGHIDVVRELIDGTTGE